ncbi:V-type ATPase subunit [Youxingia wuxianensis]|uniref:V-type ATPase subunit n=1 Tax=Youxingia wuxianensis TaxID=2763678 RepID=A0A926EQU9_9FIRM|nr:V-type ATPase subunit [Youxingia wuxianensis]MBC8586493.1 V-type ATPase subunit [Youxingia wuxianensis]
MSEKSYPYAVSRIKVLETKMIDRARWNRLIEADEKEALKILMESGYGAGAGADLEQLIKAELGTVRGVIAEITPEEAYTDLFLLPTDAHNLKALLKARLLGVKAQDVLMEGGCFSVELLEKCVENRDYDALPQPLRGAMEEIELKLYQTEDPRLLSVMVDKAIFAYRAAILKKKRSSLIKEYFTAQIDWLNVLTVARAQVLGWGASKVAPLLLEGGEIEHRDIIEALELPRDQLSKHLGRGVCARAIGFALDEYAKSGRTLDIEKRMDSSLLEIIRREQDDSFGIGPIIGYLLNQEAQARALRVLFAAKRAGTPITLSELVA